MPSTTLPPPKILIVDDETANVRLLERILEHIGNPQTCSTSDSTQAVGLFRDFKPDLVLLDLHLPPPDGFELLELFQRASADAGGEVLPPILALTADVSPRTKRRALSSGAKDFLTKPFDHTEVVLRIKNLLENRQLHNQLQGQNQRLEELVHERTGQLEEALSRLRQAQQAAIKQERLNALGTMAAGVAHDFNNALTLIQGYCELLMVTLQARRPPAAPAPPAAAAPEHDYVNHIMTAAGDAARIVGRLREFYRPPTSDEVRVPVTLPSLFQQVTALTSPRWQEGAQARNVQIRVEVDVPADLAPILGDPAELREVFTNLIFNSVDALPRGGRIVIRARQTPTHVLIEFADDGEGMDETTRRRCLEPFYTTKGEQGTGLGLSATYGIIQRHGGTIDIESSPGQGARFLLQLPVLRGAASPEQIERLPSHRPLRILLVEDQPVVGNLLRQQLTQEGHDVTVVTEAAGALEKFRARLGTREPYELVVTDQVMPVMTGDVLAAKLRALQPEIAVVLLTGFSETYDSPARNGGEPELAIAPTPGVDVLVFKPVTLTVLRRALVRAAEMARRRVVDTVR